MGCVVVVCSPPPSTATGCDCVGFVEAPGLWAVSVSSTPSAATGFGPARPVTPKGLIQLVARIKRRK